MSTSQVDEIHLRHCMLFEFRQGKNASTATEEINRVYPDALDVRKCQRWFAKFKAGNFQLQDSSKSGRSSNFDDEELRVTVEEDPRQSLADIASRMGESWSTIQRHMKQIGKVQNSGVWVPHLLSDQNKSQRATICSILISRHAEEPFLNRIVTGDEKWIRFTNPLMKKHWVTRGESSNPIPKPNIHEKKLLLCVWWNIYGVIYFELLKPGQTVTSELYCHQLNRLRASLVNKHPALVNRKGVLLHHDNARPHASKVTQQKIKELGWEVLPHPAYSPDIAPSDYHLFRSMQHYLEGKKFDSYDVVKNSMAEFFDSKDESFYSDGIKSLVSRWQKVVDSNGDYFID